MISSPFLFLVVFWFSLGVLAAKSAPIKPVKSLQKIEINVSAQPGDKIHWSLTAGPGDLQRGVAFWLTGESKIEKDQMLKISLRRYQLSPGRYRLDWDSEGEKWSEVLILGEAQSLDQKTIRKRISYQLQQERKHFFKVLTELEAAPLTRWKKIIESNQEFAAAEKTKGTLALRSDWQKLKTLVLSGRTPSSTDINLILAKLRTLKKEFLYSKLN
jgi:hypothetical protein